jgi:hypothetical protein
MDRIHGSTGTRRARPLLAALSAAGLCLCVSPEARAGDEFEDGFKDELGRLAAHEAVVVGRGILAQVLLAGDPGYYGGYYPYPTHRPRYHHDYDRGDWGHYRHYPGWRYSYYRPYWHGHGHGWGHHRHHKRHYQRHHHGHGCRH